MYNADTMVHEKDDTEALRRELRELRAEFDVTSSLVKKIHRHTVTATAMRFLWLGIIVGIPIIAYIFAGSFIESAANYLNQQIHNVLEVYIQQSTGR
ncbi:hypothetical protein A3C87_00020 [Candidatus Kaiserbacteria bacterium RIFCSPHIGHO2_02_FULL_49_34]|uniref:Uncharacterized protein n=1 Tax=Candidatus Kaiserbacteria bacterium RIFCSPHIGHO2_02_FULL_49_34 TaxID=1798491 RepID=A0A1F6DJ65_9BACT|nr:MAG: hypothetical protein A3C87_00020 [Candidatus Kaiserbacteria bacterium RIFCSPHIGHO2_02_FULL_49_34]